MAVRWRGPSTPARRRPTPLVEGRGAGGLGERARPRSAPRSFRRPICLGRIASRASFLQSPVASSAPASPASGSGGRPTCTTPEWVQDVYLAAVSEPSSPSRRFAYCHGRRSVRASEPGGLAACGGSPTAASKPPRSPAGWSAGSQENRQLLLLSGESTTVPDLVPSWSSPTVQSARRPAGRLEARAPTAWDKWLDHKVWVVSTFALLDADDDGALVAADLQGAAFCSKMSELMGRSLDADACAGMARALVQGAPVEGRVAREDFGRFAWRQRPDLSAAEKAAAEARAAGRRWDAAAEAAAEAAAAG
ncbi:unnamed protein product, partial [Prorocentrum cordatum]